MTLVPKDHEGFAPACLPVWYEARGGYLDPAGAAGKSKMRPDETWPSQGDEVSGL